MRSLLQVAAAIHRFGICRAAPDPLSRHGDELWAPRSGGRAGMAGHGVVGMGRAQPAGTCFPGSSQSPQTISRGAKLHFSSQLHFDTG